jgi:hypothetical protein
VTNTVIRWVNIGKERDGMTPDAVQYARALRPPYHLLSFLRSVIHLPPTLLSQVSYSPNTLDRYLHKKKFSVFNINVTPFSWNLYGRTLVDCQNRKKKKNLVFSRES